MKFSKLFMGCLILNAMNIPLFAGPCASKAAVLPEEPARSPVAEKPVIKLASKEELEILIKLLADLMVSEARLESNDLVQISNRVVQDKGAIPRAVHEFQRIYKSCDAAKNVKPDQDLTMRVLLAIIEMGNEADFFACQMQQVVLRDMQKEQAGKKRVKFTLHQRNQRRSTRPSHPQRGKATRGGRGAQARVAGR